MPFLASTKYPRTFLGLLTALTTAYLCVACGSGGKDSTNTNAGGTPSLGGTTGTSESTSAELDTGGTVGAGVASASGGSTTGSSAAPGDPWSPPDTAEKRCSIPADQLDPESTKYLNDLGCRADFDALASVPMNTSIPGASSAKIVLDQNYDDTLYFQNSKLYEIHYEFASANLSVANGKQDVGAIAAFNSEQYFLPDRRFLLGAVTYYSGPKYWALEMAPYDTASSAMVEKLFRTVKNHAYFGDALVFHPTSDTVAFNTKRLPSDIHIKTTEQIFAGIDYQPLRLGEAYGRLHFVAKDQLETDFYGFRDIVVLEAIPNDIAVTAGIITQEFQTPLSHVNVLATNRGTPNMGLRNASTNAKLASLKEKWVKFTVGASTWDVVEVTQEEADAWWEKNKPTPVELPAPDLSVTELRDIEAVTDRAGAASLLEAIEHATLAYGAKAANYSVLATIKGVPVRKAFAIPGYYYVQFMRENELFDRFEAMRAAADFSDLSIRSERLAELRDAIMAAPINQEFQDKLKEKLDSEYPGLTMRFRSSTNAEDLDGFPCAGCYDSHTGDPADWDTVLAAVRKTWATVWTYRTYQEREYNGIDHTSVAMALLVHHNFPDEEANGVAVTQNIYVPSGMDPAFYINVQQGDAEVVAPDPGVLCDTFLYYFAQQNQPITWIQHSTIAQPAGTPVLTNRQTYELGSALDKIHTAFSSAYGPGAGNNGWYAMDVEFKFDDDESTDGAAHLLIKQARPYPSPAAK